jgi:hypothetical protein
MDRQTIQPEAIVRGEFNVMLDAVQRGDFATAAKCQERLSELGWIISRKRPRPDSRREALTCR